MSLSKNDHPPRPDLTLRELLEERRRMIQALEHIVAAGRSEKASAAVRELAEVARMGLGR